MDIGCDGRLEFGKAALPLPSELSSPYYWSQPRPQKHQRQTATKEVVGPLKLVV